MEGVLYLDNSYFDAKFDLTMRFSIHNFLCTLYQENKKNVFRRMNDIKWPLSEII